MRPIYPFWVIREILTFTLRSGKEAHLQLNIAKFKEVRNVDRIGYGIGKRFVVIEGE